MVLPKRANYKTEMSFLDHLDELRYRLIFCFSSIFLTTILLGFPLSKPFIEILVLPLQHVNTPSFDTPLTILVSKDGSLKLDDTTSSPTLKGLSNFRIDFKMSGPVGSEPTVFHFGPDPKQNLYYFNILDPIFLYIKASLLIGIALAIPIWLWHLWAFISPAFKPAELKTVRPVLLASMLLFPIGAGFAYVGMRFMLQMLFSTFTFPGLEPRLSITSYSSFVLQFMFIFGAMFETPVVIVMLVRMGVVSTKALRGARRYAIMAIVIISAVVIPTPDPFSMLILAGPMYLLYEISVWLCIVLERKIARETALAEGNEETEEWDSDDEDDSDDN
jgi:sec-independent protein translocase protein TatC